MSEDPPKPDPKEVQSQLEDFFKDKFGGQVFSMPFAPPGAQSEASGEEEEVPEADKELDFDYTPIQVKEYLDRYVIGQEEAKKILSVAVCDHYNYVRKVLQGNTDENESYVKQNVILLGPTGVGKTYLIRTLAQLIGVPFVKADITKFSETGYVGGDVDDLVRELVRVADGDVQLAECGIIFLDEIDKIATNADPVGRDVSGRGVQTGLLKLLEETEVPTRSPFDMASQLKDMMQVSRGGKGGKSSINSRHILFVASGAFSKLPEVIEKRLSASQVGFNAPATDTETPDHLLEKAATRDFVEYGFEPEFIGRLPIRVSLRNLTVDDLFKILKDSEGSIIRQYRNNFEAYGIEVAFPDSGLRAVAEQAIHEGTGARGLMTVLESSLRDFKFYFPGTEVKRFAVTRNLVEEPHAILAELMKKPDFGLRLFLQSQVGEFENDFFQEHRIRIAFDEKAVELAVAEAEAAQMKVPEYLEERLMDYVYGLRIIQERISRKEPFLITEENLKDPRNVLDRWVKEALNQSPP